MSDAEIKRRKRLQGHISQTTSTLGLTGLGITGVSALAARKPGVLRAVKKVPGMKKATPGKMKDTAITTGLVSGGIGGVGGFNFASYTGAESRKRATTVKKNHDVLYAGEEGTAEAYLEEISKLGEWKTIDQRELSQRRSRKYMRAAGAAVGGGTGLVLLHRRPGDTQKVAHAAKLIRAAAKGPAKAKVKAGNIGRIVRQEAAEHTSGAKIGAGAIVGGAALGSGAKGAHTYQQHKINERRRTHYKQGLKKSDEVSAFGVDHG